MEGAEYNRHSRARVAETAKRRVETCNAVQRRTRRSASTIGGAAPDTIIGRVAADLAGARPYRATRCEKRVEICHYTRASSPRCSLYASVAAPIQNYPVQLTIILDSSESPAGLQRLLAYDAIPGVPLRSTPGFNPVAPSALRS